MYVGMRMCKGNGHTLVVTPFILLGRAAALCGELVAQFGETHNPLASHPQCLKLFPNFFTYEITKISFQYAFSYTYMLRRRIEMMIHFPVVFGRHDSLTLPPLDPFHCCHLIHVYRSLTVQVHTYPLLYWVEAYVHSLE
jgi:hypothetical protein